MGEVASQAAERKAAPGAPSPAASDLFSCARSRRLRAAARPKELGRAAGMTSTAGRCSHEARPRRRTSARTLIRPEPDSSVWQPSGERLSPEAQHTCSADFRLKSRLGDPVRATFRNFFRPKTDRARRQPTHRRAPEQITAYGQLKIFSVVTLVRAMKSSRSVANGPVPCCTFVASTVSTYAQNRRNAEGCRAGRRRRGTRRDHILGRLDGRFRRGYGPR